MGLQCRPQEDSLRISTTKILQGNVTSNDEARNAELQLSADFISPAEACWLMSRMSEENQQLHSCMSYYYQTALPEFVA